MESAILKGRRLPNWYLDEPQIVGIESFYINSYWDLSSTRRFQDGPIPWDKIVEYGKQKGLEYGILDSFVAIVRAMDAAFLEWRREQADRQRNQNKPTQ